MIARQVGRLTNQLIDPLFYSIINFMLRVTLGYFMHTIIFLVIKNLSWMQGL